MLSQPGSQCWLKAPGDACKRPEQHQLQVKPDIVFFGEGLPERFFALADSDFEACDLLLVMGTSLVVQPFAGLIGRGLACLAGGTGTCAAAEAATMPRLCSTPRAQGFPGLGGGGGMQTWWACLPALCTGWVLCAAAWTTCVLLWCV